MKELKITLDDDLNEALECICREHGSSKEEVVVGIVRHYVEEDRLKRCVQASARAMLHQEYGAEDVSPEEEGMEA